MNPVKLLNLAPTLILVAFLAYAGHAIHVSADDPDAGPSTLAKELDAMAQDVRNTANAIEGDLAGALRDPFQIPPKPVAVEPMPQENASDEVDRIAEIVQGLKLDATFLQGRDPLAIIDGRIYARGQELRVDVDAGTDLPSLMVVNILPSKVILRGGNRSYVLGYSDRLDRGSNKVRDPGPAESQQVQVDPGGQIALFRGLLNSPIGALGKSLIGNPGRASTSAPRSRRSRGSRTATANPVTQGP
jgi:hypothetical protein